MKAIRLMFDTLNRRMLPPYGCDWVHAPNFARRRHGRRSSKTVTRMIDRLVRLMKQNDAPPEQFLRLGFVNQ